MLSLISIIVVLLIELVWKEKNFQDAKHDE